MTSKEYLLQARFLDASIRTNVDGLLRGDYQSRMNGYAIGRQNGWMSANDIRELENLDRIPAKEGGDLYLINGKVKRTLRVPSKKLRKFAKHKTFCELHLS